MTTYCFIIKNQCLFRVRRTLTWRTTLPPNINPKLFNSLGFFRFVQFMLCPLLPALVEQHRAVVRQQADELSHLHIR